LNFNNFYFSIDAKVAIEKYLITRNLKKSENLLLTKVLLNLDFWYNDSMRRSKLIIILLLSVSAIVFFIKLYKSEQLKIFWNKTIYFYDGRHKVYGTPQSVNFDLEGELWIKNKKNGKFIRLIPDAGIEFENEQNLSFVNQRSGNRTMYKLRSQLFKNAENDFLSRKWQPNTNQYFLYFEQREYSSNDFLISYYKDVAYGKGGLFFVNPQTGEHIARDNFSTLYVPMPNEKSYAGPSNWLWAAAANKKFVEISVTGKTAETVWNEKYYKKVKPPENKMSKGESGDISFDENFVYIYHSKEKGWLRIKVDNDF